MQICMFLPGVEAVCSGWYKLAFLSHTNSFHSTSPDLVSGPFMHPLSLTWTIHLFFNLRLHICVSYRPCPNFLVSVAPNQHTECSVLRRFF
jgi:hypothetical protein